MNFLNPMNPLNPTSPRHPFNWDLDEDDDNDDSSTPTESAPECFISVAQAETAPDITMGSFFLSGAMIGASILIVICSFYILSKVGHWFIRFFQSGGKP